jgi:hypothetical protein
VARDEFNRNAVQKLAGYTLNETSRTGMEETDRRALCSFGVSQGSLGLLHRAGQEQAGR